MHEKPSRVEELKWSSQTELERDVVVSCSEDPSLALLLTELAPEDFCDPVAKAIHRAVLQLTREGKCDLVLVQKRLVDLGEITAADTYMSHFATSRNLSHPVEWVRQWVRELRDSTLRRKITSAAKEMGRLAADPSKPAATLHIECPRILSAALAHVAPREAVVERDAMAELASAKATLEAKQAGIKSEAAISLLTDSPQLDAVLGPSQAGEYILIGAATSMGKSAFALQMARNWARHGDVYFWSGEMNRLSIAMRAASQILERPKSKISSADVHRIMETECRRLWIDDESGIDIERLLQKLKIWRLSHPDNVALVVDYLGLLSPNGYDQVSATSRRLKIISTELGIPVLVACQLSRKINSRDDKKPQYDDLRDSGQIEQDADKIWMLYRPGYYSQTADPKRSTLYVRKNRDGKLGKLYMTWEADYTLFKIPPPSAKKPTQTTFDDETRQALDDVY